MLRRRRFAAVLAASLLGLSAAQNGEAQGIPVELELVLSADSSSSIRGQEFDLQIQGYASAFRDPEVIQAILGLGGGGIAVTFVQWSASFQQIVSVDWTVIRSEADSLAFADAIERQARAFVGFGTATGEAMLQAARLLEANGYEGKRRVIDISSDERSNQGAHPGGVRPKILAAGITVNGLVVQDRGQDMADYFREFVIGGPDAFVLSVSSFRDFSTAIRLKLIREISTAPLAGLPQR